MKREKTDAYEMVSVRLPKSMLSKMDDWAEKMEASRTSFIRGAIASYFRFEHGIFVPLSSEHRKRLIALAHAQAVPAETLAGSLLEENIELQSNERAIVLNIQWSAKAPSKPFNYSTVKVSYDYERTG